MDDKGTYWFIQLATSFFDKKEIDYLLNLDKGLKLIVFYLMLCLNTANSSGDLSVVIGKKVIPFDNQKIYRDTKGIFENQNEVGQALKTLVEIGLLRSENNIYKVVGHLNMVGSITADYKRKKDAKLKKKEQEINTSNRIEDNKKTTLKDTFTLDEIKLLFEKLKLKSDPEQFFNYHDNLNWKFHNGNDITKKIIQSIAMTWEKKYSENKIDKTIRENKPEWINKYMKELEDMEKDTKDSDIGDLGIIL